jgi:hypothetical protein
MSHAEEQAKHHKLEDHIDQIEQEFLANGRQLTPKLTRKLSALDTQYLQVCLLAEKDCSRKGIHKIAWTPELALTGSIVSYWAYQLKNKSFVGDACSRKMGKEAGISDEENQQCILEPEC